MTKLKYGNTPVWLDIKTGTEYTATCYTSNQWSKMGNLWFASQLECEVWKGLQSFARARRLGCMIQRQHKINLAWSCIDSKEYRIDWNVDFRVSYLNSTTGRDYIFLCEAKGVELPEYKLKRDLLACVNPAAFQSLLVIHKIKDLHLQIHSHVMRHLH
jgi:hypothetical protein